MATNGGGWTAGRIILVSLGVLVGLGILCCGGAWLFMGDQIKGGIQMATGIASLQKRVQAEVDPGAVITMVNADEGGMDLVVGVPEDWELPPERVTELQDQAWRIYAESFETSVMPIRNVGVGRNQGGQAVSYRANLVSVEEVAARTGVPAPPVSDAFVPKPEKVEDDGEE